MGQTTSSTLAISTRDSAKQKFPLKNLPMELLAMVFSRLDYDSLIVVVRMVKMDYTGLLLCLTDDPNEVSTVDGVKMLHLSQVSFPMRPVMVTAIHLTGKSHDLLASSLKYVSSSSFVVGMDEDDIHYGAGRLIPYIVLPHSAHPIVYSPMFRILSSSRALLGQSIELSGSYSVAVDGPLLCPSVIHLNGVHDLFINDFEIPHRISIQGKVKNLICLAENPSTYEHIDLSCLKSECFTLAICSEFLDSTIAENTKEVILRRSMVDGPLRSISNMTFNATRELSLSLRQSELRSAINGIVAPELEVLVVKSPGIPSMRNIHTPRLQSVTFEVLPAGRELTRHILHTVCSSDYTFLETVTDMTLLGFYDPLLFMPSTARLRSLSLLVLEAIPWMLGLSFAELLDLKITFGQHATVLPQVRAGKLQKLILKHCGLLPWADGAVDDMACQYEYLTQLSVRDSCEWSRVKLKLDNTLRLRANQLRVLSLAYIDVGFLQRESGIELPELRSLSVEDGTNYPTYDYIGCFYLILRADKLESLRIHAHGQLFENRWLFPNLKRSIVMSHAPSSACTYELAVGGIGICNTALVCTYDNLSVRHTDSKCWCSRRRSFCLDDLPWGITTMVLDF